MSSGGVSDATPRLKLRERKRQRGRALRIGTWLLIVLVAGSLVYLFGFSSVFSAQKIAVSGTKTLTKQDVLAAAGVPLGTPLATLDAAKVAERVAGLPPVAEVTVLRSWPDTLQISLVERKPKLAIPAGGGYLLADTNGVIFRAVSELPSGLVQVVASGEDRQLLEDVGTVFSALRPGTAAKVDRVEASTRDSIELRLRNGSTVIWGSAEQSTLKSQVLDDLLVMGGKWFDVSAPTFPARR